MSGSPDDDRGVGATGGERPRGLDDRARVRVGHLEEAGAAMLRSYERWLLRDRLPTRPLLPRAERSPAWTGNPEQPGHVVTRAVPRQTVQDVVRESTALFLKGFNNGEYY